MKKVIDISHPHREISPEFIMSALGAEKLTKYSGRLVVLEGIDGCGKDTQAEMLFNYLKKKYGDDAVILTAEHTRDGKWGKEIELAQQKKIEMPDPEEFQMWYVKDRLQHLEEVIIPALKAGKIVLCNRYWFSTFAFGMGAGVSFEKILDMHIDIIAHKLVIPYVTFLFDLPVAEAFSRSMGRKDQSVFDKKRDFQEKVRSVYLDLAKEYSKVLGNIHIINAKRSKEEIFKDIKSLLPK